MSKIKLGVVGLGVIADAVHLPQILAEPRFEITAICDLDELLLAEMGAKLNIPEKQRYLDYREMIDCAELDAVDIATSNDAHFEIAKYAVDAGKAYSLEKPITLDYAEAKILAEATKEKGLKSFICFSYRYKSAARYAKYLIEENNKIGEITHVNAQYYQAWALPDAKVDLVWRFIKERTGSGALGDLGSHMLDLVPFITGLDFLNVVSQLSTYVTERKKVDSDEIAKVDVDDHANFLIDTAQNATVSFEISRLAFGRGNYQRIEIYGTKGALVYQLDATSDSDELFEIVENERGHRVETRMSIPAEFTKVQMSDYADVIKGQGDNLNASIVDGASNQYYLDRIVEAAELGQSLSLVREE